MTDDPDLRARLQRLASIAGDPPEQGLEKVAARRHRRLRRRRGAVVTAAALAVLLAGVSALVEGGGGRRTDIAVSPAHRSAAGTAVQLPNMVEMRCGPGGIDVPVASVRPQRDGLHMRVINDQAEPTEVWVDGEDGWSSGRLSVDPGLKTLRVPVPPGVLTIGCTVAGRSQQRRVDLDDADGYYQQPVLACDADDVVEKKDLPVDDPSGSLSTAAKDALSDWGDDVATGAVHGYPGQRLGDFTDDPVVQVERDGDVVAFVHLRGRDGEPAGKWTTATLVEGCSDYLTPIDATTSTTEA